MSPFLASGSPPLNQIFITGVNAVASTGVDDGGWVSGNPANLAASGSVDCVFDLGAGWQRINAVGIAASPSGASTGMNATPTGSDTPAFNADRRLNDLSIAVGGGQVVMTGTAFNWLVKPMGRYFVVRITNTDGANPQGAGTKVTIATYTS